MVLQLAEKFYNKPGLYDQLIASRPKENIKAKAVELVKLLKSGKLDYGWEYLSVAAQQDLKFIRLDDQINLGNYKFDDFYKQAAVKVTGKTKGSWITRTGKSITYGITLIKESPNPKDAVSFLQYLLDPAGGLEILKSMGQPPFVPARGPAGRRLEPFRRNWKPSRRHGWPSSPVTSSPVSLFRTGVPTSTRHMRHMPTGFIFG